MCWPAAGDTEELPLLGSLDRADDGRRIRVGHDHLLGEPQIRERVDPLLKILADRLATLMGAGARVFNHPVGGVIGGYRGRVEHLPVFDVSLGKARTSSAVMTSS